MTRLQAPWVIGATAIVILAVGMAVFTQRQSTSTPVAGSDYAENVGADAPPLSVPLINGRAEENAM